MKVWICQQTGKVWVAQDANGNRIVPPGLQGYGMPPSTPGPPGYGRMVCLMGDVDPEQYEPAPGELMTVDRRVSPMHSGRLVMKSAAADAPQLALDIAPEAAPE